MSDLEKLVARLVEDAARREFEEETGLRVRTETEQAADRSPLHFSSRFADFALYGSKLSAG